MAEDGSVKVKVTPGSGMPGGGARSQIANFVNTIVVSGRHVRRPIARCSCKRGLTKINDTYKCRACGEEATMKSK